MTSNSWLLRGILTPPWNEEDVQSHLNLRRHGYISCINDEYEFTSPRQKENVARFSWVV